MIMKDKEMGRAKAHLVISSSPSMPFETGEYRDGVAGVNG